MMHTAEHVQIYLQVCLLDKPVAFFLEILTR